MSTKNDSRLRRARRSRTQIRSLGMNRLSVHRTPRHIYAQIIAPAGDKVIASASTLDSDLRSGATGNIAAAEKVGKLVAERFRYHGRVKALADAARETGLEF